jgi:hypothetical protein
VNAVEITPEAIAALSSEEKRELALILETLEMPVLARRIERIERARSLPADPNAPKISYCDALQKAGLRLKLGSARQRRKK